jgi:hypothetical protein
MTLAFDYLINAGGIMSEDDYPYIAKNGDCRFDASKVKAKSIGLNKIEQDEYKIEQALFDNGPLSVAINATPLQFFTR